MDESISFIPSSLPTNKNDNLNVNYIILVCWKFTWNWLRLNPGHEMRVWSVQYNIYYVYACERIYNLIESFNFFIPFSYRRLCTVKFKTIFLFITFFMHSL